VGGDGVDDCSSEVGVVVGFLNTELLSGWNDDVGMSSRWMLKTRWVVMSCESRMQRYHAFLSILSRETRSWKWEEQSAVVGDGRVDNVTPR